MPKYVHEVREDTFEAEVLERSREAPVIVDFWAPWCGPCRELGPILEELAEVAEGAWILAKVNSDENADLSRRFGVQGIPHVLAFVDGQVVEQFTGAVPKHTLEKWLRKIVPTDVDLLAREAVAASRDGDSDREFTLWTAILEQDPEYHVARVRRARIFLANGAVDEARKDLDLVPEGSPFHEEAGNLALLSDWSERVRDRGGLEKIRDRAADDPEDVEARYDFGCALATEGKFEDALAEFLEVVKQDRSFDEDAGRLAMLALFSFLGDQHSLSSVYRGLLARALY